METTTPPQNTEKTEVEKTEQKLSARVTDAIVLALASAGAYLCSFLYERGYISYFGIPQEFINVSLVHLLIFGAGILSLLWAVFAFYNVVFPFMRPEHPYLAHWIPWMAGAFLLIVLIPLFIFGWEGKWFFLFTFSGWLLFAFIFLILPLIVHRKSGGWAERYNKQLERLASRNQTDKSDEVDFQTYIGKRFGYRRLGFLIYMAFQSTFFINLAGITKAEKQEEFLITNTTPAMAVLRVYDDNMICAPFDRDAKEVKKSFLILKVAGDEKLVLNLEKIGPLKPVEKLASENITVAPVSTPSPTSTPEPTVETAPSQTPISPTPTAPPVQGELPMNQIPKPQ